MKKIMKYGVAFLVIFALLSTEYTRGLKVEAKDKKTYTVVIDAGHQSKQNTDKEPIGPGAKTKKAKVSSGTQGKYTKVPEYQVNLEVAKKLQKILQDRGYKVVMIRTKNNVNISNAQRAKTANKKGDIFIRLHCNGDNNTSVSGALTMCMTKKNPYNSSIYKKSRSLSDKVIEGLCNTTKAKNRGVIETDSMSGINWCKIPVTIVEMGFMTNKKEDKKLVSDTYQDKLAEGIANGIDEYFKK